jgi:hypothetical protein
MSRHGSILWICMLAACAGGQASAEVSSPAAAALEGTWRGSALSPGSRLEFNVRFSREGGALRATMSCRDLLLLDQPLDSVRNAGERVRFSTPGEQPVRFELGIDGDSLRGSAALPPVAGAAVRSAPFALGRDSTEVRPPYETRDVQFTNGGARLAGTLYAPASGQSAHAGVVILQASSMNLRTAYRFYADQFARAGLAVLTFDKRGNGESSGDYLAATYDTLAGDAAAAVDFLRAQPGVDPERVGVWGLSQGACIAPLVAARVPSLRFIVAISAPGLPVGESEAYRDSVRLGSSGFDPADVMRATAVNRRLLSWLYTGEAQGELGALLREADGTPWARACSLPARLPSGAVLDGWYWRGRTLDPVPWWHGVQAPVLALFGTADGLIAARSSAKVIERTLRHGHNGDVTVYLIPAANPVMRLVPPAAGSKWDWPRAAPGYMESVTNWMLERARSGARSR